MTNGSQKHRQYTPISEIRADKISFEQILLRKMQKLDDWASEVSEDLDRKKLRRFKTELENFNAWIMGLGSEKQNNDFYKRILPLKLAIAATWGIGANPVQANRWELFKLMTDYSSVVKFYAMTQGKILPTKKKVLLVGKGVFDEAYLKKNIGKIKPTRLGKAWAYQKSQKKGKGGKNTSLP